MASKYNLYHLHACSICTARHDFRKLLEQKQESFFFQIEYALLNNGCTTPTMTRNIQKFLFKEFNKGLGRCDQTILTSTVILGAMRFLAKS